jgi:hypothetical protein
MKLVAALLASSLLTAGHFTRLHFSQSDKPQPDSTIGIKIPPGYRDWPLITVAHEEGKLNDLRAILGNKAAIQAFRKGKRPFPDGTIIARLAWDYSSSPENNKAFGQQQSFVAGHPKNGLQFMVKDTKKYALTDGWGYVQFNEGKPASNLVHATCAPCHQAAKERDFVFSTYAP